LTIKPGETPALGLMSILAITRKRQRLRWNGTLIHPNHRHFIAMILYIIGISD
jgi:hypothetical protein